MNITVAAAQYPITSHTSIETWQSHVEKWVSQAVGLGAALLVFPEYGSMELVSLFPPSVRVDIKEQIRQMDSLREQFCVTYATLASRYQVCIVAPSFPVYENEKFHNRAYVFSENGLVGYQDKFFMTRFENEHWGIQSAPKVLTVFEADWGCFGIQICYDIEFSLGTHLLGNAGAALILGPSCTEAVRGAARVHIGARARAMEAQAYTVVSQTINNAEWSPAVDINYGYTAYYSTPDLDLPEEGIVKLGKPQTEGWLIQSLDLREIEKVRNNGQVFNHKDHKRFISGFPDEEILVLRKRV